MRSRAELERLVSERTAQLEKANQSLRLEMEDRQRLERQVLQSIEREQQRIGQDLHDGLCQLLTGIKFKTSSLEAELSKRGLKEAREAKAIEKLVNHAIRESYGLARGLNPVKLPGHGLTSALAELAGGLEAAFEMRCVCELAGAPVTEDHAVANHLYRIAQEAIHNAIKHGKAKKIVIRLDEQKGHVVLTVKDDGTGFPPDGETRNGMGLPNMKARAGMIGGSLDVRRGERGGTTVTCSLPTPAKTSTT
jgi:signal transduction histidine kinase